MSLYDRPRIESAVSGEPEYIEVGGQIGRVFARPPSLEMAMKMMMMMGGGGDSIPVVLSLVSHCVLNEDKTQHWPNVEALENDWRSKRISILEIFDIATKIADWTKKKQETQTKSSTPALKKAVTKASTAKPKKRA